MKTRSSSGVGQKVDLEFNVDTLRITDLGDENDNSFSQQRSNGTNSVMDSLKRTSVVSTSTSENKGWERASPKEGFNLEKPRAKTSAGPLIRNMLDNLNPEKD